MRPDLHCFGCHPAGSAQGAQVPPPKATAPLVTSSALEIPPGAVDWPLPLSSWLGVVTTPLHPSLNPGFHLPSPWKLILL